MSDDVYTRTDRRRGQIKGAKRQPPRRRGQIPFEPTEQQRHVVSMCAGIKMGHNEIARLILNPLTSKPICVETLEHHFPEELATGNARLRMALSHAFYKLVAEGSENSVLFGMRAICGFDDRNIQPAAFTMNMKDGDGKSMRLEFVLPGSKIAENITALESPPKEAEQRGSAEHRARETANSAAPPQRILPEATI